MGSLFDDEIDEPSCVGVPNIQSIFIIIICIIIYRLTSHLYYDYNRYWFTSKFPPKGTYNEFVIKHSNISCHLSLTDNILVLA